MSTDKFEQLEKKLNIATELIDELNIDDLAVVLPSSKDVVEAEVVDCGELVPVSENDREIFSLESLKSDFIMIRQNVMKLIANGQRILDSASLLDVSDMKASQLTALSNLQETLGNNMKLMVGIYKEICEIEKMRIGITGSKQEGSVQIATGNNITNNNTIVFAGDTTQLLDIIKENQNT